MAPVGTVIVSEVDVVADTAAFTAPKNTVLLAGVVLKLLPVTTTVVPIGPDTGLNEEITGAVCACIENENNTRTSVYILCLQNISYPVFNLLLQ